LAVAPPFTDDADCIGKGWISLCPSNRTRFDIVKRETINIADGRKCADRLGRFRASARMAGQGVS
jgi:hypothetical protein